MAPFRIPDLPMAERAAILQANQRYSESFGEKGSLPLPPARRIAILTCMDARLDPAAYAGLQEGDAHVIRNAGGRASDDAIRSLVISYKLLGTQEWFVIHHSNCGMEFFTDSAIRSLLANSLQTAVLGADGFSDVGPGRAPRLGISSTGSRSAISARAWSTMFAASVSILWCLVGFRSMASSTRWRQVN